MYVWRRLSTPKHYEPLKTSCYTVMVPTTRIAAAHESFDRIRQVAPPICTAISHMYIWPTWFYALQTASESIQPLYAGLSGPGKQRERERESHRHTQTVSIFARQRATFAPKSPAYNLKPISISNSNPNPRPNSADRTTRTL